VSFADREDGVGFTIVPALAAHIPGFDRAQTEDLLRKAHQICPYSNLITVAHEVQLTAA
jgi:organic hydroperoxide reductase OsmC/OhrA